MRQVRRGLGVKRDEWIFGYSLVEEEGNITFKAEIPTQCALIGLGLAQSGWVKGRRVDV